jgi:hypothetical protein
MLACIDGLDGSAEFADGYELSPEQVAMISTQSVGRMLAPAEVSRLISWIKSELQRKNMETNQQHLESIDRFAIASELFDDPAHCLPTDALGRLGGENKTRIRSL